jgi:photosystem I subunit 9
MLKKKSLNYYEGVFTFRVNSKYLSILIILIIMKNFTTYLSTAPVLSFLYFGFLAGLLIEINRFYPDALVFPFLG